jgi:hypothetical protein
MIIVLIAGISAWISSMHVSAKGYYIATNGSDENPGTLKNPFF